MWGTPGVDIMRIVRRLARYLFDCSAGVSFIILLSMCILWVRGMWLKHTVSAIIGSEFWQLQIERGLITSHTSNDPPSSYSTNRVKWRTAAVSRPGTEPARFRRTRWNRFGF